jgi:hypothetical protein
MENLDSSTARKRFFAPLIQALDSAIHSRECQSLSDKDFLKSGVGRIMSIAQSGRDWVQGLVKFIGSAVTVNSTFKSLRSERRLLMLSEVAESVAKQSDELTVKDPFSAHPELDGFDIHAGDGHYHKAAVHEKKIDNKKYPVQHFYSINMRTRTMHHLDVARPAKGKKKEHDITALKRFDKKVLRMKAPKGKKVIWVYDRAVIDFLQWYNWKHNDGIYVITREKAGMALRILGKYDFDREDPRNIGVIDDQMIANSGGTMIRRVIYVDPVSGKKYNFLTNEFSIPPGLIAFMYKERWNIEKVFDEVKNKLHEKKAWATSYTAKCIQAKFIAITHNLLLIFEHYLEEEEGITDEKVKYKRQEKLKDDIAKATQAKRKMSSLLLAPKRATQRSVQFIRWLRDELHQPTSWRMAISELRPLMLEYLC